MGHTVCFCAGELVIELLARLNDPRAKLVITHHAGDEGLDYLHQLQEMATAQNVDFALRGGYGGEYAAGIGRRP